MVDAGIKARWILLLPINLQGSKSVRAKFRELGIDFRGTSDFWQVYDRRSKIVFDTRDRRVMFAVPGWSVSADVLVQQSSVKPVQSDRQKPQEQAFADSKSKSKKRKRPEGELTTSSKVSAEDLERLWSKQFGDKAPRDRSRKDKNRPSAAPPESGPVKHQPRNTHEKAKVLKLQNLLQSKPDDSKSAERDGQAQDAEIGSAPIQTERKKKRKRDVSNREEEVTQKPAPKQTTTIAATIPPQPPPPPASNLTPLQAKMRNKLTSARFRHLNQTLYTTSSSAALDLFTASPDLFAEYHAGFSQQVKGSWPQNPVDVYIKAIKTRGMVEDSPNSLPRRKTGSCTIADLGCGDAPLARGCQSKIKDLQLKFHNFDLHAPNTHVTKADISNLPLRDGEADIAVFCLSLMGTNWLSFVEEAWRVLRGDGKGEVWVAEVKSRFGRVTRGKVVENSVGKKRKQQKVKEDEEEVLAEVDGAEQTADETDVSAFVDVFQRRGFELRPESVNKANKMFVSMSFVKSGVPTAGKHKGKKWNGKEYRVVHDGKMRFADENEVAAEAEARVLKPCVYKTR